MNNLFRIAVIALVARLILMPFPDLLAQEAYYWNYAQHLDFGYLDHPPLSAWLIALSQKFFGVNEFAVRFPAFACSLIALYFVFQLSREIFDLATARCAAALFCTLPYFFGIGFFISPDAPLVAAWSAALFFAWRVLNAQSQSSSWADWCALGAALGIGMLSKYTIALCGISFLCFVLLDSKSRVWLSRPQPYLAALIALVIFSPVIYWNATHDWASFVFQGSRRLEAKSEFSLHVLILHLIFLATPAALLSMLFIYSRQAGLCFGRSALLFSRVFFLVPVGVFALFSLRHEPKFIWCGPAFLALLPLIAKSIAQRGTFSGSVFNNWAQRAWPILCYLCVAGFVTTLIYLGPGVPFIGYKPNMNKFAGWQDLGAKALELSQALAEEQRGAPIVVGMDKHYVGAELAFYCAKLAHRANAQSPEVAGRSIFGLVGLMWHFWRPAGPLTGRPAVLVSRYRTDLEFAELTRDFEQMDPIIEYRATHAGKPAGVYYLRVARGFRGSESQTNQTFFLPD